MTISLRQVPDHVSRRQSFKCNKSLFAEHREHGYVVFSYGHHFPVAVYDNRTGEWTVNSDKYSPTTSRHQSTVKRGIPSGANEASTEAIREAVDALH
jgi:hypothetical protein